MIIACEKNNLYRKDVNSGCIEKVGYFKFWKCGQISLENEHAFD